MLMSGSRSWENSPHALDAACASTARFHTLPLTHGEGQRRFMTQTHNQVTLTGRVSASPEAHILPSGDEVVSFRLIVQRSPAARRRSKQPVDTIDCAAWTTAMRRVVRRLEAGTEVVVTGELRRRFSRGATGPISRVTVELDSCQRADRTSDKAAVASSS